MPEMPHPAKQHGHAALVGGVDYLLVTHGATGLNDAGHVPLALQQFAFKFVATHAGSIRR